MMRYSGGERGVILLLTFIIMVTLTVLAGAFLYMTAIQARGSGYDVRSQKAFWIAEGGLQQILYRLKNDSGFRNDVTASYPNPTNVTGSVGDGGYSAYVTGSDGTTFYLTSTGTVGALERQITQTAVVSSVGGGGYPGGVPEAFEYGMHSFGQHTKFMSVTNGTVNGDVAAATSVQGEGGVTISGDVLDNSPVDEPTPINMAGYEGIADHVVDGNYTFEKNTTYTGVYYIKGNAEIEGGVTINGTVVAEGNINIGKVSNVTITAGSGYPALLSRQNIQEQSSSHCTIDGLIYADNNVLFQNSKNLQITGCILSGNNIEFQGSTNLTVNYDPDIVNNPPPFFPGFSPGVSVTPRDWDEVVPAH